LQELETKFSKYGIRTSIEFPQFLQRLAGPGDNGALESDYLMTVLDSSYFIGDTTTAYMCAQGDMILMTLVFMARYAQQQHRWRAVTAAHRATLTEPHITKAMVQAIVLILAQQVYYYVTGHTVSGTAAIYRFVLSHCNIFDSDAHVLASAITLGVLCFGIIVIAAVVDALLLVGTVTVVLQGDAPPMVAEPLGNAVGDLDAVAADIDEVYYDASSEPQPGDEVSENGARTQRGLIALLNTAVQRAQRAERRVAVLEQAIRNAEVRITAQDVQAVSAQGQALSAQRDADDVSSALAVINGAAGAQNQV
jgi:hypothetical protein